jgi:hypothetical protein
MHFMFTRAAGPPWVKGCVCADPHEGHAGRAGRPPEGRPLVSSPLLPSSVIGIDGTRLGLGGAATSPAAVV